MNIRRVLAVAAIPFLIGTFGFVTPQANAQAPSNSIAQTPQPPRPQDRADGNQPRPRPPQPNHQKKRPPQPHNQRPDENRERPDNR